MDAAGLAKKTATNTPNVSTTPIESTTATGSRLQTFGSWLDTAYVNAPGETWMWVSTSYWRSPSLREIDAPAIGVSVGVAPRTQVGVSLPYYHLTDQFGFTSHGIGASYGTLKFALVQDRRVTMSVSPTLEILSWNSPQVGRVNAVLPISLETYAGSARFYGSTGYFTRGSVFGSGAAEWSPDTSSHLLRHSRTAIRSGRIRSATRWGSRDIEPMRAAECMFHSGPLSCCSRALAGRSRPSLTPVAACTSQAV